MVNTLVKLRAVASSLDTCNTVDGRLVSKSQEILILEKKIKEQQVYHDDHFKDLHGALPVTHSTDKFSIST